MRARLLALVFGSGMCALIYQGVWMRQLRLVFGASTAASAAVLAIFMLGLGIGGLVLGARAQRSVRPLRLYAWLELGIALAAASTLLTVPLVRGIYLGLGGSFALGPLLGTLVRLLGAATVLAVPTLLMGGTLPALARVAQSDGDAARREIGTLYAVNTVGAVLGVMIVTFALVEWTGITGSLLVAVGINGVIGGLALWWDRADASAGAPHEGTPIGAPAADVAGAAMASPSLSASVSASTASWSASWSLSATSSPGGGVALRADPPKVFVYIAAALVGFVFFAMEIVWYRLLTPLLGGTSFSFGVILACALAGIGLGAWWYGRRGSTAPPTLEWFAASCALEAVALAWPWAVGDGMAMLALQLRALAALGFWGLVTSWAIVTALFVVPPAILAGAQFPALIALLGRGRDEVATQVGRAYAANTAGAFLGAIGSGFGLMVLLGATGLWRACIVVLVVLSLAAILIAVAQQSRLPRPLAPSAVVVACLLMLGAGPSVASRMAGIGAGRMTFDHDHISEIRVRLRRTQGRSLWVRDGIESTVGVHLVEAPAIIVNGKSDGEATGDAPTAVMAPLLGAALHGAPRRGLVIGLGTGESAGWLAEVESIERVDVVELEPTVVEVARLCAPYNFGVIDHPKVQLHLGDGREFVMVSGDRYDVIMSEPSNPYRAGVASLFSRDFYRRLSGRLADDGVFVQWLQGYETDAMTLRTVVATLRSEFAQVEIWRLHHGDYGLVARKVPRPIDLAQLKIVTAQHPYREALDTLWGVSGPEGLLSAFIAGDALTARIAEVDAKRIDTDDRPVLEYGFARSLGAARGVDVDDLMTLAEALGAAEPEVVGGSLDAAKWLDARDMHAVATDDARLAVGPPERSETVDRRHRARRAARDDDYARAREIYAEPEIGMTWPGDRLNGAIASVRPVDALLIRALAAHHGGDEDEALSLAFEATTAARDRAWFQPHLMRKVWRMLLSRSMRDTAMGTRVWALLEHPLAGLAMDEDRREYRVRTAAAVDFAGLCPTAFVELGVTADLELLEEKVRCYTLTTDPRLRGARAELETLKAPGSDGFGDDLRTAP